MLFFRSKSKMEFLTNQTFKALDFIADNLQCCLVVTISITAVVLILSTKYAMDNIFTIWNKGKPEPVAEDRGVTEDEVDGIVKSCDVDWSPKEEKKSPEAGDAEVDPMEFCEHLQSEVKKARQRVATREIQSQLTKDDLEKEREIQRKQLEDIFKLMAQQEDKFGVASVDDINQQMKMLT